MKVCLKKKEKQKNNMEKIGIKKWMKKHTNFCRI